MSMMGTSEYIQMKKDELSFLVRVMEDVYGDKEKLSKSLMKGALLGLFVHIAKNVQVLSYYIMESMFILRMR